jgi:hypothetical protein
LRGSLEEGGGQASLLRYQEGYMGLGPASMHPDTIYILAGSQLPFVLRAAEDVGVYSLVGESYVHGMMDGEAVAEDVDLETICLI